jgi:prepilin-type processing-associated H-X9-DG protein
MKVAPVMSLPKSSVALLAAGSVLLTCGVVLLVHAWVARFTAVRFLESGIEAKATIHSIEHRGARHGGRRINVSFWDKRHDSFIGDLKFADLTDLVPIRNGGEKEGDEIGIRWIEEGDVLRLAPERSLHAATRPPEMQFAFGIGITATGGILLGIHTMREARRRERPGEMR